MSNTNPRDGIDNGHSHDNGEMDHQFDVVVVGTGAAGMTAAVTAALRGLSVVVLEKTDLFGGTTAYSGAAAWIPANHVLEQKSMGWQLPKVGLADSAEKAKMYLERLVGPTVKPERIDALLREGPRMIKEFEDKIDMHWLHWTFPDYFSELPGGISYGRTIEPTIFDGRKLGPELETMRGQSPAFGIKGVAFTGQEGNLMASVGLGDFRGAIFAIKVALRTVRTMITREKLLGSGQSFLAQMRLALKNRDVPVWLSTPMEELIAVGEGDNTRVIGIRATRNGTPITIGASRGVILATGGFSSSQIMRDRYLAQPTQADWSLAPDDGQDGDGITAAEKIGADLDLTEKAWGFPTVMLPNRQGKPIPRMALYERMKPGVIVVNGNGKRYFDEGMTYENTWKKMYEANTPEVPTIPSWIIFDGKAKFKYGWFAYPPVLPFPRWWMGKNGIQRAKSIRQLADKIGVPASNLEATVGRFNQLCDKGHDDDFGRGDTAFARYFGDGSQKHPNLGPLTRAPFYAVAVWPGDIGTKGGVKVDENAQALRPDGSTIAGLYAAGNTNASVMGDTYPGGGGTVGPAMTLAYIAVNHLSAERVTQETLVLAPDNAKIGERRS